MKFLSSVIICILLIPTKTVSAAQNEPPVSMVEMNQLLTIINECVMDESCILTKVKAHNETNPKALFTAYLKIADAHKAEIDMNIKFCSTKQAKAYKKALTSCGINSKDESMNVDMCIIKHMTPLVKANNMYAQFAMLKYAEDEKKHQALKEKLQKNKDTVEGKLFNICAPHLSLVVRMVTEAVHLVAAEKKAQ